MHWAGEKDAGNPGRAPEPSAPGAVCRARDRCHDPADFHRAFYFIVECGSPRPRGAIIGHSGNRGTPGQALEKRSERRQHANRAGLLDEVVQLGRSPRSAATNRGLTPGVIMSTTAAPRSASARAR